MSFVAGNYTVATSPGALGLGQAQDGINISWTFFKQPIVGNLGGQSVQDTIYQGGEMGMEMRLMEWDAAALKSFIWPYSSTYFDISRVVGTLDIQDATSVVQTLILTALAGTSAATTGPATMTFQRCVLREGTATSVVFSPDLRTVPLSLRIFQRADFGFGDVT